MKLNDRIRISEKNCVHKILSGASLPCTTAVGTINQTQATEYCFTVNDLVLLDSPFNENNIK